VTAARKNAPRATRRQRVSDREGVEQIEHLPKSFTFMQRTQNTRERREVAAVVEALRARPGQDARVKRLQKRQNAEEFAETLRQYAIEQDIELDVDLRGNEVFARFGPPAEATQLPADPPAEPMPDLPAEGAA
jgi:hypothetical protein